MPPGAGGFFMPPGSTMGMSGMQGMPGMGMQGMPSMMSPQQLQQMMMMNPQLMQYAGMQQQGSGSTPEGQSIAQSIQNLQGVTMGQLGQMGMSPQSFGFPGGMSMGMNPAMMQGMAMQGYPGASQAQRGSAPATSKKKEDEKK